MFVEDLDEIGASLFLFKSTPYCFTCVYASAPIVTISKHDWKTSIAWKFSAL